jgi:branched-chain amino acid transport system permease protein
VALERIAQIQAQPDHSSRYDRSLGFHDYVAQVAESIVAEILVARFLGFVNFDPRASKFKETADVGSNIEVRWTRYDTGQLIVYENDRVTDVAVLVTGAFGWVQDAALWRPLRKRRMGLNQMMIVSIGFSIVVRYVYLLIFDGDTKDIAGGGNVIKFGPVSTTDLTLWGMLISVVALGGVALFLTRTRIGKATRAVSDNAALASATGIDVERIIRIVWVTAAALTGLAGVLYGLELQANWLTGFDILLLLFASVTLGGLGTALGATVGALIIGMVVEVSSLFIPNELRYAAALVILIVILIWRPQGVLGKKQRLG